MRNNLSPDPLNRTEVQSSRPSRERDPGDETAEMLMARCVGGEGDALGRLYRQYVPGVLGYLRQLCRQRDRAEDLVQITFLKVHRARERYVEGAAVGPWLYAIARNSFRDDARSKIMRHETLDFRRGLSRTRQPHVSPTVELRCALARALAELSETDQNALVLTKVWGYSGLEAGRVLRITPTAVKLRAYRAARKLRRSAHLHAWVP